MQLAKASHTVGNRIRFIIDYSDWLDDGVTVSAGAVTSSSTTATINGTLAIDNKVLFYVNGGVLAETFTVSIQMTDSKGEIKNDTMAFTVVAP